MKTYASSSRGFSLVEITVALGIVGFCLLALFGLLPVGLNSNQISVEQTLAANLATMLTADLRATPIAKPVEDGVSPQYKISIPASTASTQTLYFRKDGKPAGAVNANANANQDPFFRAMMTFKKDSSSPAMTVRLLITWPAMGDLQATGLPKNFRGSFETVIALDRT